MNPYYCFSIVAIQFLSKMLLPNCSIHDENKDRLSPWVLTECLIKNLRGNVFDIIRGARFDIMQQSLFACNKEDAVNHFQF